MVSADFSRPILFQPHATYQVPYVRETSSDKSVHFQLICLLHLLYMDSDSYWTSSCLTDLYAVPVRKAEHLPPASFRLSRHGHPCYWLTISTIRTHSKLTPYNVHHYWAY